MGKYRGKKQIIQSFWKAQMFKNRMIYLYKILEKKAEAIVEAAEQNPELYLYAPRASA